MIHMEGKRILVLDAESRAGLATVQALGRRGHVVHAGVRGRGSLTEASRWCQVVHDQPSAFPREDAHAWLADLDRRFAYSLIVPATEASLLWIRALPEGHRLRTLAVVPGDRAIDVALDKERTCALAADLGIPVAPRRLLARGEAPPEATGFPVVLKPVHSKVAVAGKDLVSMSVAVARNEAERAAALALRLPYSDVIEQTWVHGRGVGVEMLFDRGRLVAQFVHERLHEKPLTGGGSTLRRAAAADPVLIGHSRRLLEALDWHGVAMVEWRRAADGTISLMEINPRLWGSLPLTVAAGVDIPHGLLAIAAGAPFPAVTSWRVGVTARSLTDDVSWCIANARADHADPLLLTEPVAHSLLGWLRGLSGREHWDGWSLADPKVAAREAIRLVGDYAARAVRGPLRKWQLRRIRSRHRRLVRQMQAVPARRVLFLCMGNICRSAFAATAAAPRLPEVAVESGGFYRNGGRPTPDHVVQAAAKFGVDLSSWSSRRLTAEQVAAADLIIAMDLANLERLQREFPEAMVRATLLGLFRPSGPVEIADPISLSPAATERVLGELHAALDCFLSSKFA